MAVLDVRGTHGSGKSWVARRLVQTQLHTSIEDGGEHLGYHLPGMDLAIVGRYQTPCGGCDGIKTADEVVRRVRLFAGRYRHVLLEGILVAHTFRRYSELADEMEQEGQPYHFLFLNTPLKTCVARVQARRLAAGTDKPFNPTNLTRDWHNIWGRVRARCVSAGHRVHVLDYTDPLRGVVGLLQ